MTAPLDETRPWAFSSAELTAGLRALASDPSLTVTSISELTIPNRRAARGRIRGLGVSCNSIKGPQMYRIFLKEARAVTRAGTVDAGLREVSLYRLLNDQLPVKIPRLYAAHPAGQWLAMEMLDGFTRPENWREADYEQAIDLMVALHDRFWGLGQDLKTYPWLARPLTGDFAVHVSAAQSGIQLLMEKSKEQELGITEGLFALFKRLIPLSEQIASQLRVVPTTLVHGDYWPGNICRLPDGEMVVIDWQKVAIGPGILDLCNFIQLSLWWFGSIPISTAQMIDRYRSKLDEVIHYSWTEEEWFTLWDYSLMWTFLADWIDILANTPASILGTQQQQLEYLWINPIQEAIRRRFPGK